MSDSTINPFDIPALTGRFEPIKPRIIVLVSWIAPNGDYYLEPEQIIQNIIETGSWK